MSGIVTRADGQPAFVHAQPRLRQSHVDALRHIAQRYADIRAEEAALANQMDQREEPSPAFGAIIASGLFGILMFSGCAVAIAMGAIR